jgi:shikimate dehydrogenase
MDKLFVIGNPIKHSQSPIIHNYWLKKYGINCEYTKLEIQEKQLKNLVEEVRNGTIRGFNVTIPFKQKVVSYLDKIDSSAQNSFAVNTVYKKGAKVVGANTDGKGFIDSLTKDLNLKFQPRMCVFLIGAGGAAHGIFSELLKKNVSIIEFTNRTESKARNLVSHFYKKSYVVKDNVKIMNTSITIRPWSFNPPSPIGLVINTSSLGMKKTDKCNIHFELLSPKAFVYDIIYSPKETIIMKEAIRRGISCSNGIYMLIRQAAESFRIWFDIELTNDDINEVVKLMGYQNNKDKYLFDTPKYSKYYD